MSKRSRPSFIVSANDVAEPEKPDTYPDSDEPLSWGRGIGLAAGLTKIGLHVERVPPGIRVSWPHAHETEEEFVFVLEGEIDAWVDGELHTMRAGDLAAFPAGTGICHTFINNSAHEARLLVGGERTQPGTRIFYPLNDERRSQVGPHRWWTDIPARPMGLHDGISDAARKAAALKTSR